MKAKLVIFAQICLKMYRYCCLGSKKSEWQSKKLLLIRQWHMHRLTQSSPKIGLKR